MNYAEFFGLMLRYVLEFLMLLPLLFSTVKPVLENLKFKRMHFFMAAYFFVLLIILLGSYAAALYSLKTRYILIPCTIILFALFVYSVDLSFYKKFFCFISSVTMCQFADTCAIYSMAQVEIHNPEIPYTLVSGFVSLGIAFVFCMLFYQVISYRMPKLLNEIQVEQVWKYLIIVPTVLALILDWSKPVDPSVILTGRVREIGLVVVLFLVLMCGMFYHILWFVTEKLTANAKIKQENMFLTMESKRYNALKKYVDETRSLRHDMKQHAVVLSGLAAEGKIDELKNYLKQFEETSSEKYKNICVNNPAVDAVAVYYDEIAANNKIAVKWNLELPSNMPVKEFDYCAVLGNLLDNAIEAVKNLPVDLRVVNVESSMLSWKSLGLVVENPLRQKIIFGDNGLPRPENKTNGLGLLSVQNTVNRYNGTMIIKTDNNKFSVSISMQQV